jgi:hypothetical protein
MRPISERQRRVRSIWYAPTVALVPLALLASACQTPGQGLAARPPIIDMHLHAHSPSQYGGGMPNCANDQQIVYPGIDPRESITLGRVKSCASPMPAAAT